MRHTLALVVLVTVLVPLLGAAGVTLGGAATFGGAATPAGNAGAGARVFVSRCAGCHTLARAGTIGTVGPNLDRLKPSAAQVARQVRRGGGLMPAFGELLGARQIRDVAAYVAAATHGKAVAVATAPQDGRSLFKATCGACHTLADAGTTGTRGPSLDDESPSLAKVASQILEGDPPGMPSFSRSLTATQISRIATYVAAATDD